MNYAKTLQDIINYYVNLLIIQYHDKPKAKKTIALLINIIWANMIIFQIRDAFNWKTAIGNQLDIIGKWLGIIRFYNGILFFTQNWFSLIDWNNPEGSLWQGGFSTFDNFNQLEGGFLDYINTNPTSNKLDDTSFRIMIGLKIISNNLIYTAKNIDDAIWNYFNGDVYTVWSGNKVTYYYKNTLNEIMQVALFYGILPAPTGVEIELQEI